MRPYLDHIISKTQSGFLSGRNIADSTRFIYDIMQHAEEKKLNGILLLIDFEKAFDSLSWTFLYNVLTFFGFDEMSINWIKLFNTDIEARISQAGFLSDPIKISRGCRQGDPISCYLFILAAEILAMLIKDNPYIVGLDIGAIQYKLVQFADDTTLILDGTQNSLQAALNTLEVYGTLSGLKVNSEKTKVIWIGKRKNSKEKLKVSLKLNWGETRFRLLGLEFSVNLDIMPGLNYEPAIDRIKNIINHWKRRNITPIGKITVIKTLLLPQFNHLFTSIWPEDETLDLINNIFFRFLWGGKSDKIRRGTIYKDYKEGGLKMVNIQHFQKSLILGWIKKIVGAHETPPPWFTLISTTYENLNGLTLMGPEWCNTKIKKTKNLFWNHVFSQWVKFCAIQIPQNVTELLNSSIWYNKQISKEVLFLTKWHKNRIDVIGDVVKKNGTVMSVEELRKLYRIDINMFDYIRVKGLLNNFIKKSNIKPPFVFQKPYIPSHVKILFNTTASSRDFYKVHIKALYNQEPLCQERWNNILNDTLDKTDWVNLYRACFYVISDSYSKWFQYRVINQILGTRQYLNKIGLTNTETCRLCNGTSETLKHLLTECPESNELWKNIISWVKNKLGINLRIGNVEKILGYYYCDKSFTPVNFLLLHTRK